MIDKVLFCPIILLTSNEDVDFSIDQFQGISDYLIKRPNRCTLYRVLSVL
jgi:PleD family two-component response regulator